MVCSIRITLSIVLNRVVIENINAKNLKGITSNRDFPAMTNNIKGKDEQRFATEGSTEQPEGREARQAVFSGTHSFLILNLVTH